ncbi:MAG: GDP-mannose 4,6-dehydratase [Bacteroidota bacterium]
MNIFITGGAGFIGSNLTAFLLEKGHKVKSLDNLSTGRMEHMAPFMKHPDFEFIKGNVTKKEEVEPLMQWCDHCYHLAAPVGVKYIMEHPVHTILDNVRGIDNILALTEAYKKRTLIASTSEIYGKSLDFLDPTHKAKLTEESYRVEGSTRNHRWAYANTKAMDEFLAFAYHKEYQTEIVIARFFNTVGPKQLFNYGMVIPNFVKRALDNEEVLIFGTGKQQRSFMHVDDAIRAITELMFSGKGIGQEFNVGNPIEISMEALAKKIIEKTGSTSKLKYVPYEEAYGKGFEDMNRRTADITKLRETLGFELKYNLDTILDDVIKYYREQKLPA